MSLNPTGSLNFSWAKPSIPFENLHVYTYKNDIFLNSRIQTGNSVSIGGLVEGDSVFLKIIPQSGGALFTDDSIETAKQAIPITNFHPNTLDINKIFFNGFDLSKSRDAHGVYKATGKYNTIDFNIDLEIINPRDSGIISYVGEEPFFSGVRFYENLSGFNYTTGFSESFRFSSQNSIGQRSLNFNFIAEDVYGSGVSGSLELINDPPEILSTSSTFDIAAKDGFIGFSIFPETQVDTNRIDYKIYNDQTYTSHFISGTTSEPSIITGLFPVNQTGYIEMIPFDFLGSGVTYRDPDPFVPNVSSFVATNSISSHFAFGDEMTNPVVIEMTVTEEHDAGYYTKLSIDSSSSGSFNASSYFTGLLEGVYSGYHFDVFNNRTGDHENFYYNLEIYKSGTNSLEDAAQGSFFMPNPHFAENSVDFDYRNGSTRLGFDSMPHYSYTGVNILFSGEHDSNFSIYSGNSLYSGSINVKARAQLVRSFDNQIFDEITISGSGTTPSISLRDIPYPYLDGTVNQVLGNPNASVYIDSVSVFRKPTFEVVDGIVPANLSGILDFNDYANYFIEETILGHYTDEAPKGIERSYLYEITGMAYTGGYGLSAVTGEYASGRHYSYKFVPINGYGSGVVSETYTSSFGGNALNASTEEGLVSAEGDISVAQTDIGTAQSDISTAQSDISTAQSDISTAQSDISTAQSDISTAQSDISTAQADITGVQANISGVQNSISGLQTSVVYVTGNQLIQGTKTFDGDVHATGAFLYNNMPPTGTSSYGKSGQIAFDASYLYVCTGNNSWGRIEFTDSVW